MAVDAAPAFTAVPLPPGRESRTKSLSRASRSATVDAPRPARVANKPDPSLEPPATVIVHVPEHELRLEGMHNLKKPMAAARTSHMGVMHIITRTLACLRRG